MPRHAQPDLFAGTPQPAPSYLPDPAKVREKLFAVLAQARAAPEQAWRAADRSYYAVVFPQMCNWLPASEAVELRAAFAVELARLESAG